MAQDVVRFETLFSAPTEESKSPPQKQDGSSPMPDMGLPFTDHQDSYQELERKYRHRTYQAQELMVEKLLRGHFIDLKSIERKLSMFDLHFDQPRFMVILVHPVGNDAMFSGYTSDIRDGGQVGLIVSSIFSELLGDRFACYPANLEDRYAFLLNVSREDEQEISRYAVEICRDAVKFIQENFSLDLRVCVSGTCEGLFLLHDAFRETELVAKDPNTQYVSGVCAKSESSPSMGGRKPETIEKQYLNALVTQDFQVALHLTLEKMRTIYAESGQNLNQVKIFLSRRMQTTGSVLTVPLGELLEDGGPTVDVGAWLELSKTMDDLENNLHMLFEKLDSRYNTVPSNYTGTTGKVIHLIEKRYMEPDLSVEMICDALGKSRSYLSRMFKENTGMNLLDYLHTTRLAEAKKLLNNSNLGISQIASQVGYYSGWTLARVFKRYEGITPTAYRKAFCGEAET